MPARRLRYRQVHLDFHTSPHIPDVGAGFASDHWQQTLRRGHVDSITLFATCHHGYAYYNTQVGQRHPNLAFDLLRRQFEATKAIDIHVPIYLTAGINNWAAHQHPEWREVGWDGRYTGRARNVTDPGFHAMCFNSPYLDLLCDQVREVVSLFPQCDGIFLDIIDQGSCCCRWCLASMAEAGLDATVESDRKANAEAALLKYYHAATAAARSHKPDMPVFHNSGHITRGRTDILRYFSHLELESLPTGGWGYDHFPLSARYVAQLGLNAVGMTGKFHTTWGEFGGYKHPNALRYECASMLAHGTRCSVGDQLHPSGQLDESTYDIIGAAYREVYAKQAYCEEAVNVADIGLVSSAALGNEEVRESTADTGAVRILLEGHFLFDVLDAEMDFGPYKLLILPDDIAVDAHLKQKIDTYLKAGGRLLLTGRSGLTPALDASLWDIGATVHGPSPYQPDYALPIPEFQPAFCASPIVMYLPSCRLKVSSGRSLGQVYDPYFNRTYAHFSSHQHAPNQPEPTVFSIGVSRGPITYLAHPVFSIYAGYGGVAYRHLITRVIDDCLGDQRTLRTNLPSTARLTLTRQPGKDRYLLHLLYANKVQRGGPINMTNGNVEATKPIEVIEELTPLCDVEVEIVGLPHSTQPSLVAKEGAFNWRRTGASLMIHLDSLSCHEIINLEHSPSG